MHKSTTAQKSKSTRAQEHKSTESTRAQEHKSTRTQEHKNTIFAAMTAVDVRAVPALQSLSFNGGAHEKAGDELSVRSELGRNQRRSKQNIQEHKNTRTQEHKSTISHYHNITRA